MDKVKLLPCPFCGAPPEYEKPAPSNWQCASVMCRNPCCVVKPHGCVEKSPEKAIAAWNTRPPIGTDEVVERVVNALDLIDELYRKYNVELDAKDVATAQAARAAIAALPAIDQDGGE